jgi:hypothetical protein
MQMKSEKAKGEKWHHLVMRATGHFLWLFICLAHIRVRLRRIHGASGLNGMVVVEPKMGNLVFSHKITESVF